MRLDLAIIAVAAAMIAEPGFAQTQAQLARLNLLGRYAAESGFCEKFGFTVKVDDAAFAAALGREFESAGVNRSAGTKIFLEAVQRRYGAFQVEVNTFYSRVTGPAHVQAEVRPFLVRQGHVCAAAAADQVFSGVMRAPENFDPDRAATQVADDLALISRLPR